MTETGNNTRFLGASGLRLPVLTLGTMTFGGAGRHASMGAVQIDEARHMVDICLDRGVNFFDTANVYSAGLSEEGLGQAIGSRRRDVLLATKLNGPMGSGPNDQGQSRHHIIEACEASLRRLGTDYIDLYQVHSIDERTPLEESLSALDDLVRQGKIRYIGCSNYSAWHLMKALSVSERRGFERYVSLQAYYSLVARELEHELLPVCLNQGVGVLVWSPLAAGFLTGKQRRRGAARRESPSSTRRHRHPRRGAGIPRPGRPRRDRQRPRRQHRAGRDQLAHPTAGRELRDHRGPDRGPAERQPRSGRLAPH
jgi:aryl-alcohol dehydrogenase-like predicted oxidoreductase